MDVTVTGSGNSIIFQAPADPRVWYAPETLIWLAALVLAPLLVALALRAAFRAAGRAFAFPKDSARPADYGRERIATALAYPGYQWALLVLGWAVLLFWVSLGGSWLLSIPDAQGSGRIINTSGGLPAALALLCLPSIALAVASLIVSIWGAAFWGTALPGSGLLTLMWLYAAAIAGAFTAVFAGIAGVYVSATCLAVAAAFLMAALWYRKAPGAGGETVLTRARYVEATCEREYAARIAADAPTTGEYAGMSPRKYWGRLGAVFLGPSVFFCSFSAIFAFADGDWSEVLFALGPSLGFGSFLVLLVLSMALRFARYVRWNEKGVDVAWYRGASKDFQWTDLERLKLYPVEQGVFRSRGDSGASALVVTATGEKLLMGSSFTGYDALEKALAARIWGREQHQ